MGSVSGEKDGPLGQILVSANCSLTGREAALFFGITALASLGLAGVVASRGFWPVLPFAGIELFALGLALGLSLRRGSYREVVTVYPERVVIEWGAGRVDRRVEFPRCWTRVELEPAPWRGHPRRLLLRCHGRSQEIGKVLTESERESLGARVAELIAARPAAGATAGQGVTKEDF